MEYVNNIKALIRYMINHQFMVLLIMDMFTQYNRIYTIQIYWTYIKFTLKHL